MLVLSRRARQRVVFPHLGISISVLQVRGRIVKIGIEAPDSITVLREEVLSASAAEPETSDIEVSEHQRRNEINLLQLRLLALQSRIDRGEIIAADSIVGDCLQNIHELDRELALGNGSTAKRPTSRPARVLIVEDCDNERGLMAYLLASHNLDVQVARDGLEAIEQLRFGCLGGFPEFVLMDMQMPGANGLETLQYIREDERLHDLKVFAVTGSKRNPELEPAGRGWDGWFSKPLNIQALLASIKQEVHSTKTQPSLTDTGIKL